MHDISTPQYPFIGSYHIDVSIKDFLLKVNRTWDLFSFSDVGNTLEAVSDKRSDLAIPTKAIIDHLRLSNWKPLNGTTVKIYKK